MPDQDTFMTTVFQDNARTAQAIAAERAFEEKAERHFNSQRELPRGRNFLWNTMRFHDGTVKDAYAIGMCRTFPNAPGSRQCGACTIKACELRRQP